MEKPIHFYGLTEGTREQSWIPLRWKHSILCFITVRAVYQIPEASIQLVIGRLPCLFVGDLQCPTEINLPRLGQHLLYVDGCCRWLCCTLCSIGKPSSTDLNHQPHLNYLCWVWWLKSLIPPLHSPGLIFKSSAKGNCRNIFKGPSKRLSMSLMC